MFFHVKLMPRLVLLLTATVVLAGCQSQAVRPRAFNDAAASIATLPLLRQDAFKGIYEVAVSGDGTSVFVAAINDFDKNSAGFVHRLDARTLRPLQTVQVPRRSFALGLNNATGTLYVGNTMEGALSVVNADSGLVEGQIQLAKAKKDDDGEEIYAHSRKVVVDQTNNRIFVTSPGRPGLIWIVDGVTNALTHTITSDGIWSAGAAYDSDANRLYVGQGGVNEVLVIDPDAGTVVRRFSTGETTPADKDKSANFFINIALDVKGKRLFAAGGQKNQVYVWDTVSGQVIHRIPFQTSALDIIYNSVRNEVVTTHRGNGETGSGFVAVLDGATYEVKRTIDLPVHPNSVALSPDGNTLYVTVKAPHSDKHPAWRKDAADSVVRIDLL